VLLSDTLSFQGSIRPGPVESFTRGQLHGLPGRFPERRLLLCESRIGDDSRGRKGGDDEKEEVNVQGGGQENGASGTSLL
jgi:hypothetical protein